MPAKAPVMFISHGSPMWAMDPGVAGKNLGRLTERFSGLRAVLIISPHWATRGLQLTAADQLDTIHDFGGFPEPLYRLRYPAKGYSQLAEEIAASLQKTEFSVGLNDSRGLDHGAWVPLMHLIPNADIPVLQLSLDMTLSSGSLLELGRALSELRNQGVGIIASGGITHNLFDMRPEPSPPVAYASRFQNWIREQVVARNIESLSNPEKLNSDYKRAHPTAEHFLPLLVAMGASNWHDALEVLKSPIQYGVLSMESYLWQAD